MSPGERSIRKTLSFALVALCAAISAGCQQEMANQPRYNALQESAALVDGIWKREPVTGTIARGELRLDAAYYTGKVNGQLVSELPERALQGTTMSELLTRGRKRYNVFCSHCHGQVGGGTGGEAVMREAVGMVVKRGFPSPPTYHQERLRQAPIGHFYDVITSGLGRMAAHGYLVPPQDRWAISAYIRALQLSQNALPGELSEADASKLSALANEGGASPRSAVEEPPAADSRSR